MQIINKTPSSRTLSETHLVDESDQPNLAEDQIPDNNQVEKERTDGSNIIVYVILALTAIGFAIATYFLLHSSDEKEFTTEIESFSREVAEMAESNANRIFGQLRSFATAITSVAVEGGVSNFPYVTIPHFDLRAQEISSLTGAEMIIFVPFVEEKDRKAWEEYAVQSQGWFQQDYEYRGWNTSSIMDIEENIYNCSSCEADSRRGFDDSSGFMEEIMTNLSYTSAGFSAPISQYGPGPINSSLSMLDLYSHPVFKKEIVASLEYDVPVVSEVTDVAFLLNHIKPNLNYSRDTLRSFTLDQVKENFTENARTIGYLIGVISWETIFVDLLPSSINGIDVVVESDCGSKFTYTVNGGKPDVSRTGDHHDVKYNASMRSKFFSKEHPKGSSRHCHFDLVTYPTDEFHSSYESDQPAMYAGLVVVVMLFTAIIFFLYDRYSRKKQRKVISHAKRAEAIITSVFPREIGMRLMAQAEEDEATFKRSGKSQLTKYLENDDDMAPGSDSKPLADLFPNTTVMFADITGFTAWSSTREPSQVFILLETIYRAFDGLAKRRGVFKVETVGDCYVAVSGLPDPREDHPVVMSYFAADCLVRMSVEVQALEVELGPDTAELGIRVGLHSGPVTAGVLRGERARFQLFGDTVNTAARIESTGEKNRVHLSKETADLLTEMGKGHWFWPREEKVTAKGKGELQTFWLKNIKGGDNRSMKSNQSMPSRVSLESGASSPMPRRESIKFSKERRKQERKKRDKLNRLIDWNVDMLFTLLKQVELRSQQVGTKPDPWEKISKLEKELSFRVRENGETALDEVVEIVELPRFNNGGRRKHNSSSSSKSGGHVQEQLRDYVRTIAGMYNENHFHNFEHASHVTMSVTKLLNRIVAPDIAVDDARELHDHTYGITSDPLTQFAVVFSAMLHDVDHLGVPNSQLVKEEGEIAHRYKNKSVAEQNSIDLGWSLLMEDRFEGIRRAIYSTKKELKRFRQLVVNTILATDIMDKELKSLRNARWDQAFSESAVAKSESAMDTNNRKATIVIEHLIQASDIAHTMQHWQIYKKWNARLFQEMYRAYLDGRSEKDPSEFWYEGEIGFFDFYIIPLAKKLESCGVFGVSSDEYLNYALQNRQEWEIKGRSVVDELVAQAQTLEFEPRSFVR